MNLSNRLLAMCLTILLTAPAALSQEKRSKPAVEEEASKDGLRKIASGSGSQDVEVHIDDEALEATIESSIENAMEIVHDVLQTLEINIEPVAIDVSTIDLDIDPIHIDVPRIDIDLDELEVNDHDVDIDINEDVSDWNDAHEEELEESDNKAQQDDTMDPSSTTINKNKGKDSADRNGKEKAKGLKKIN